MKSLALFILVALVWGVGLLTFADRAARMTPAAEPAPADAIVVLTGASTLRLETGLQLLEAGKGARLLVSGVNTETTRADIQDITKAGQQLYDCCVDLGFSATDTVGNGRETAAWAAQHGFTDLIVVTAAYHMPRAMLEIRSAMPDADLRPYPVKTTSPDVDRWWRNMTDARRMILEYNKYLAILIRESIPKFGAQAQAVPPLDTPA